MHIEHPTMFQENTKLLTMKEVNPNTDSYRIYMEKNIGNRQINNVYCSMVVSDMYHEEK